MVDDNEGLLREVEEELRRERLASLWQTYGNAILIGLAVLVAGVGGWKYLQNQQLAAAQKAGMSYQSAMETLATGKTDEALKAFDSLAKSDQAGYHTLAALQLAGAHLKQGESAEAKAAFEKVAADTGADSVLRDYATLQAVALNVGEADLSDVQNRLNRFMKDESPWRANARELVALAAFKAKEYDVAKVNLRAVVADPKAAAGTIQRANTLLASIAATEVAMKGAAAASAKDAAKPATATSSDASVKPDAADTSTEGSKPESAKPEAESNAPPEKKD